MAQWKNQPLAYHAAFSGVCLASVAYAVTIASTHLAHVQTTNSSTTPADEVTMGLWRVCTFDPHECSSLETVGDASVFSVVRALCCLALCMLALVILSAALCSIAGNHPPTECFCRFFHQKTNSFLFWACSMAIVACLMYQARLGDFFPQYSDTIKPDDTYYAMLAAVIVMAACWMGMVLCGAASFPEADTVTVEAQARERVPVPAITRGAMNLPFFGEVSLRGFLNGSVWSLPPSYGSVMGDSTPEVLTCSQESGPPSYEDVERDWDQYCVPPPRYDP
ncbi:hypothetical protein ACOMHN_023268 [Nucella lapillus]